MQAREVLEACLCVSDLDAAREFYTRVLGLTLVDAQPGRHVFFRCGQRMVLLFDPRGSLVSDGRLPAHGTTGVGHLAFAASEAEFDAWEEHLARHHVAIEARINWPQGGRSLYFRDPGQNCLEIATPRLWGLSEAATLGSVS